MFYELLVYAALHKTVTLVSDAEYKVGSQNRRLVNIDLLELNNCTNLPATNILSDLKEHPQVNETVFGISD